MHESELEQLTARVDALEREVAQLRYGIGAPAGPAPSVPPSAPPVTHAAVTATPAPAPSAVPAGSAPPRRSDLESIVGGRGLLFVGAFLVLIGVASFLKIAFDRGWVGPPMRVAIGLIAGAALVAIANAVRKRIPPLFADALVGIGAAVLYLSLYGAGALFSLVPLAVAALGMVVVTATICILAYRDHRQPLAHFGIVGGMISPLLLGGNPPDRLELFAYMAVLSTGAIALGDLRNWRAVPIVALIGTAFYWFVFSLLIDPGPSTGVSLAMALVFYALFASTMLIAWRRNQPVDGWRIAVTAINAVWFFFGITALSNVNVTVLAIVFLAVAALHTLAGLRLHQRPQFWFATIALSFAIPPIGHSFSSLARPAVISTGIHLVWALEATSIGVLGARWHDRGLLVLSGAIFATVVLGTLGVYVVPPANLVFNQRFLSLIAVAIGLAVVRRITIANGLAAGRGWWIAKVAIDVLALLAISPEAIRFGEIVQPHNADAGGMVALSIAWAAYAGALIVTGIRGKIAVSRWEGLALLGVTVIKVFIVDLTDYDVVFRVVSALGLGVTMLVLAYLYQSRLRASKGDGS